MTIAEKLQAVNAEKQALAAAIRNGGETVPASFGEYHNAVAALAAAGGSGSFREQFLSDCWLSALVLPFTEIPAGSYDGISNDHAVTLTLTAPGTLTIGENAFRGLQGLFSQINVTNALTAVIGDNAFSGAGINEIMFDSATRISIGNNAFEGSLLGGSFYCGGSGEGSKLTMGYQAFSGSMLTNFGCYCDEVIIGDYAFAGTGNLQDFTLNDTTKVTVGGYAFQMSQVASVYLSSASTLVLDPNAFSDAYSLTDITFGAKTKAEIRAMDGFPFRADNAVFRCLDGDMNPAGEDW